MLNIFLYSEKIHFLFYNIYIYYKYYELFEIIEKNDDF
jgi:hypothetical protein